jgi:PAS domain-containing protein
MKEKDKTHKQFIKELTKLRHGIAELESSATECEREGEALWESEKAFIAIVENANVGIFISIKGIQVHTNKRASEITGHNRI